ncbi:hypothetical protein [Aquimarina aquimarini]|uniref:hypothetical protein n=1 Tax=Aquimarina aquimarini TaxID=1191734 RepID=UPI000D562856|nr:hypothetical protein [Aquimarina aquimarini]
MTSKNTITQVLILLSILFSLSNCSNDDEPTIPCTNSIQVQKFDPELGIFIQSSEEVPCDYRRLSNHHKHK